MILCDTNVWLALSLSKHSHHQVTVKWFEKQSDSKSVCFCRATQQSYLRLLSTTKLLGAFGNDALTNRQAWGAYSALLEDYRVSFAPEPPDLDSRWTHYGLRDTASPKLWMDSYLAAFAVAGGLQLVTLDRGFRQFEGLNLEVLAWP